MQSRERISREYWIPSFILNTLRENGLKCILLDKSGDKSYLVSLGKKASQIYTCSVLCPIRKTCPHIDMEHQQEHFERGVCYIGSGPQNESFIHGRVG